MDSYEQFDNDIKQAVEAFKKVDEKEIIRLVSHHDADGISAAALIVHCMNLQSRKYSLTIVQQIKRETLEQLAREPYSTYIFTDLGSGALSDIEELFAGKTVFILDHHDPEKLETKEHVHFVSPHKFGIDGGQEVSGSGVAYLFASTLDERMKDFAHVAIIGAVGDMQERNGFERINNEILQEAIKRGKIKVIRGLRLFGAQTKPLYKVLEYCTDPYIPGVSGSESGSIQFLQSLGINPKREKSWKKVMHLTDDEMKKVVTGVILKRLGEDKPEDVLGNVYILREEKHESPTKDVKEFATLLNACGRLEKASLGIGACLGDVKIKKRAISLMGEYKKEIVASLRWMESDESAQFITKKPGYMIINSHDKIRPSIIGTVASIMSKSNNIKERYILSMADNLDDTTKISLRSTSRDVDLKKMMVEIVESIEGCESGGHENAAGALIPTEKEEEFLEQANRVLSKHAMEEAVIGPR